MTYKVRRVDNEEEAETLDELHSICFAKGTPRPDYTDGFWWIAYKRFEPVGFGGLNKFRHGNSAGYLVRAGVRKDHRGHGLQTRLIKVRERKGRELGWTWMITDTTDNIHSANNLIANGYRLFWPVEPWAFKDSLYFRKELQ